MAYIEPYPQVDYYDRIMQLPIATNEEGDQLYHGLEWAKKQNIVVVWEDTKGWMRGKSQSRYRVIPTHSDNAGAFTVLKSGRSER